ncbi:MAG: hypothetical protein KAQ68_05945, partial [Clostridiales bacterium]|nr:hypothetical protein [Clostridiales bacterium]
RNSFKAYCKQLLQPGFLIFIFFIIILYPICKPIVTGAWDEYSHWALIVRNMIHTGALPKAGGAVSYLSYPPATALFQYLFMKLTGGSEGMMYYAQAILLASCFSVLLKGQSFKKPWYILLLIIMPLVVIIKFGGHNIFNIFTDTIMAVVVISCFIMYSNSQKKYSDIVKISLVLFVLSLIRIESLGFAVLLIIIIVADQIHKNGIKDKSNWKKVFTLFIALLLSIGLWKIHLNTISSQSVEALSQPITNVRFILTLENYMKALFLNGLGNVNPLMYIFTLMSSTVGILICIIILNISMHFILRKQKAQRKKFRNMNIMFFISWVLYNIALLYTYLFKFTEFEGTTIASFGRYMATFFIFWLIGISYMMIKNLYDNHFESKNTKRALLSLCLLMIIVIVGLANPFKLNFIGDRHTENVYEQGAKEHAETIHETIGTDAKVYLVFQKSRGYTFMGTRYQLATNPANLGTWSMGEPYSDADTWTVNRTAQEFLDVLHEIEYEYVYIGHGDQQFWDKYGELFDVIDAESKTYKVTNDLERPLTAIINK